MRFEWSYGDANEVFQDALSIRRRVFIEEQQVDEALELDNTDDNKHHLVGYIDNLPQVTARIYPINDTALKIQRVAVNKEYRGKGLGRLIMTEIENWARQHHYSQLILSAQDSAIPFYEAIAFHITDPAGYLDANIPHHDMEKILK